ncbi:hypothetical protein [Rothia nasimurium]|uniref:hypothetical protein n=1 Tax=Rothia nasimurium TaxID=85336 RepID=UPI001F329F4D|nr:hypothetical protein [Rothia nasimurium]
MTHNVSRRTLAKGAAWAAPAVVATTAIPAYAASSTCSTAAQYEEAMAKYFADFASKVPDLSNTKLRLWYVAPPHPNGGGDGFITAGALRVQGQNVPALISAKNDKNFGQQFGFEFGIRNVDTSGAVNRLFAPHLSERVGSYKNVTLPNPYHASGGWDTRNGNTPFGAPEAVGVNDTTIRRDGGWSSSFGQFEWNRTGGWHDSLDETQFKAASLNGVNYLSTRFALDPSLPFYRNQLFSGNTQDLIRLAPRDGTDLRNGGAIYIAYGLRPIGVQPPTYQQTLTYIKETVKCTYPANSPTPFETFFENAYYRLVDEWVSQGKGLGGLQVVFSGWGISGNIEEIPAPVGDFLWSHEIGNFNSQAAYEGEGTRFVDTTTGSAWEQVNRYAGGLWASRDTGFGKQVYYRDGIF